MNKPNYKAAFQGLCEDMGAVTALLGLDGYPDVDMVLRAITDLGLAAQDARTESARLSAALSVALAQLEEERARRSAVAKDNVYLLMGHAHRMYMGGENDMPAAMFDLAARIAGLVDPAMAERVQQVASGHGIKLAPTRPAPPLAIIPGATP